MAKIRNNLVLHGLSGMLGRQVVVRRRPDGTFILTGAPHRQDRPPSETQATQRKLFTEAAAYAKGAQQVPEYRALAEARKLSAFNVAMADFFHAPEIGNIDLSAYDGDSGQSIVVSATDDVKVTSVEVAIATESGSFVEKGSARHRTEDGSWVYTTTSKAPSERIRITASAADLAGNVAEQTATQ